MIKTVELMCGDAQHAGDLGAGSRIRVPPGYKSRRFDRQKAFLYIHGVTGVELLSHDGEQYVIGFGWTLLTLRDGQHACRERALGFTNILS